ncbi:helix-turn-helix domain-containing protein [Catalinimonas niigatensis]|uniref:helix-turn-helix domain-containing protein n=1 Tax=Catalinimonas niigatensis TaxID=1397264 RepID=UPI00266717C3|nr:helix-turn-helix domain-containing protein [Catalinimonas niigatensis]WPP48449.1 helix-turn-helix domain-containing protein [Catalinimonas niigatensis]
MKSILLFAGLFSLSTLLFSAVVLYGTDEHNEFLEKRAPLVIRKIGHKLLLHAGDSSSRVLPVRRINPATFQLEFQSAFSFVPDSLVEIVRANLAENDLPLEYIVNVMECHSHAIVYGFAMGAEHRDIVPCLGRVQPEGYYTIQIGFQEGGLAAPERKAYLLCMLGLGSLLVLTYVGKSWVKNRPQQSAFEDSITIGSYAFDQNKGILKNKVEIIQLSGKESQLLRIFASRQNQLIERDRLLKEVWEDEGVFTGRSLDVFVSRLRKKLQNDPAVRLINVHSRGYKLEVDV